MYQLHYTLDTNLTSHQQAIAALEPDGHKILQHYNIDPNGLLHYELLTSKNFNEYPLISQVPEHCIRVKVETLLPTSAYIYVEKHFKLNYNPCLPKRKSIMLTKVINPTTHSYIVTIRARNTAALTTLESLLDISPIHTTTEYCLLDTFEHLDYIHT